MLASRTSARAASAAIRAIYQRPAAARSPYSTAPNPGPKNSSSTLPILAAVALAAGSGAYYFMTPSPKPISQEHLDHIVHKVQKGHELTAEEEAKIKAACLDLKELYRKNAPKATHGGPSELNHEKFASTKNEHKVRHGVFSGKDFDNHIATHSKDPSKDFEIIEKSEAESAPKK